MRFMDLFKPKWKRSNPLVRAKAIKTADYLGQNDLYFIALEDRDPRVKMAAVENPVLTEQEFLAKFAKNNSFPWGLSLSQRDECIKAKMAAVAKVSDDAWLADIARSSEEARIIWAALDKMQDAPLVQAVLESLALNHKEADIRRRAADGVVDQNSLRLMVQKGPDDTVRKIAAAKIEDQSLLSKIANDVSVHYDVRRAAVKNPHFLDPRLLADVARKHPDVFDAVMEKLTDQTQLAELAVNGNDVQNRIVAANKLKDRTKADQIFANAFRSVRDSSNKSREIRISAVSKISDPVFLEEVAADQDLSEDVRLAAVENPFLDHREFLCRLAVEQGKTLALAAVKKLFNEDDYEHVFLHAQCREAADAAAGRIKHEERLLRIAATPNIKHPSALLEHIEDDHILEKIFHAAPHRWFKNDVRKKIKDPDIRKKVDELWNGEESQRRGLECKTISDPSMPKEDRKRIAVGIIGSDPQWESFCQFMQTIPVSMGEGLAPRHYVFRPYTPCEEIVRLKEIKDHIHRLDTWSNIAYKIFAKLS